GRAFSAELDQPAELYTRPEGGLAPSKLIINVSASRALGFASAQASLGQQVQFTNPITREMHGLTVIGVAADTNFYSLNAVPRAEVYSLSPGLTDVLTLRFEGSPETLLTQVESVWRAVMGDAELS